MSTEIRSTGRHYWLWLIVSFAASTFTTAAGVMSPGLLEYTLGPALILIPLVAWIVAICSLAIRIAKENRAAEILLRGSLALVVLPLLVFLLPYLIP